MLYDHVIGRSSDRDKLGISALVAGDPFIAAQPILSQLTAHATTLGMSNLLYYLYS